MILHIGVLLFSDRHGFFVVIRSIALCVWGPQGWHVDTVFLSAQMSSPTQMLVDRISTKKSEDPFNGLIIRRAKRSPPDHDCVGQAIIHFLGMAGNEPSLHFHLQHGGLCRPSLRDDLHSPYFVHSSIQFQHGAYILPPLCSTLFCSLESPGQIHHLEFSKVRVENAWNHEPYLNLFLLQRWHPVSVKADFIRHHMHLCRPQSQTIIAERYLLAIENDRDAR